MQYIGIDMSKDTFHAAFDEQTVAVFENNKTGIKSFQKKLELPTDVLIGLESTGAYHLLFCSLLTKQDYQVKVINSLLTHRMISSTLRKVKTDRTDALAIRKTLIAGSGYIFTDTPEIMALKTLVQEREAIVRMRAQTKQRIHVHQMKEIASALKLHDSYKSILKAFSKEIQILEGRIEKYLPDTQKLLRSIPGVGRITAVALIAHIGNISRFSNPEKLTAYIGLDPRVHQSGTSILGKGYITKRGNTYLRWILFNAAFVARQKNPDLKAYFEKKITEGKHYFVASCAVERKLIHLIHAVWSRGTPYENRLST